MMRSVKILTLNIHKGFSSFNRNFMLPQLKSAVHETKADIVFLQEVIGEDQKKQEKYSEWPESSHYEFLADEIWSDYAYAKNAVFPEKHYGNAILSRFPIRASKQIDVSTNRFEQRGFLYTLISIPDQSIDLHCVCVHLGLLARSRKKQMRMIAEFIDDHVPHTDPVVVAGDFNDWTEKSGREFFHLMNFQEAFQNQTGKHAKTFPSYLPFLKLDRIYYRDMDLTSCQVYGDDPWPALTDHRAISASFDFPQIPKSRHSF